LSVKSAPTARSTKASGDENPAAIELMTSVGVPEEPSVDVEVLVFVRVADVCVVSLPWGLLVAVNRVVVVTLPAGIDAVVVVKAVRGLVLCVVVEVWPAPVVDVEAASPATVKNPLKLGLTSDSGAPSSIIFSANEPPDLGVHGMLPLGPAAEPMAGP